MITVLPTSATDEGALERQLTRHERQRAEISTVLGALPLNLRRALNPILSQQPPPMAVGLTGSLRYSLGSHFADIDLVAITDQELACGATQHHLRTWGFATLGWPTFAALARCGLAHVYACWHEVLPQIRIEVLDRNTFARICSLERFTIRRIRRGPIRKRDCVMNGTDGSFRTTPIRPIKIGPVRYSSVPNILEHGSHLWLGMHAERCMLAGFIQREPCVESIQDGAWDKLQQKEFRSRSLLALDGTPMPEQIFFGADTFCHEFKDWVRARFLESARGR